VAGSDQRPDGGKRHHRRHDHQGVVNERGEVSGVADPKQHAEGEADVDDLAQQGFDGRARTVDYRRRPAELLGVGHPVLDRVERPAVVEVGRVHGVASVAQRISETADGICEPERVVKDDDLSHAQEHKRSLGISASAC
jgi:hypothetical protein